MEQDDNRERGFPWGQRKKALPGGETVQLGQMLLINQRRWRLRLGHWIYEIEVCCYREFRFRKSPTGQNYCDQFSRNHTCVQMVKFSYTRLENRASQQFMRKGLWFRTQRWCHAILWDGDVNKGKNTDMGGAECLYQWTAVSLRGTLPERGSVFLYWDPHL